MLLLSPLTALNAGWADSLGVPCWCWAVDGPIVASRADHITYFLCGRISALTHLVSAIEGRTNVNHIAASARVEVQWRVASRAVLRVEFADELVETSFVRHMRTGELQHALASQSVLQRLFADSAFTANKGPLAPRAAAIRRSSHDVVVDSSTNSS